MPSYVVLFKITDQGRKDLKGSPVRVKTAIEAMKKMGGKLQSLHYTMGEYDLVGVAEFPSDEVAAAFALGVASQGNASTHTMRAFSLEEMSAILAKLP
jgi:uncharacterized protein with GYD domain